MGYCFNLSLAAVLVTGSVAVSKADLFNFGIKELSVFAVNFHFRHGVSVNIYEVNLFCFMIDHHQNQGIRLSALLEIRHFIGIHELSPVVYSHKKKGHYVGIENIFFTLVINRSVILYIFYGNNFFDS